MGLFRAIEPQEEPQAGRPLADRMRPQTLDEFVGQEDLLAPGKPLRTQIEHDDLSSMLFWGPPGCGKTTLARISKALRQSPGDAVGTLHRLDCGQGARSYAIGANAGVSGLSWVGIRLALQR